MQAGKERLQQVRAGFITQGLSLKAYCLDNDIDPSNASKALVGKWTGIKATALVNLLIDASKADIEKIRTAKNAKR